MDILLVGAGRTGREIVENLLDLPTIKKIYLFSRTLKSAKSLSSDLATPRLEVVASCSDKIDVDYVIITLSTMTDSSRRNSIENCRTTYEMRQDELKYNLGPLAGLIPALKKFPDTTKFIVVSNPVDELTNFLQNVLSSKKVYGFGLQLDVKRYRSFLKQSDIDCIGTHGHAIPLIGNSSVQEYNLLAAQIDEALFAYVREHGIPNKMAGIEFKEFFEKLTSKDEQVVYMSKNLDKPFQGVSDLCISLPFVTKNGDVLRVKDLKLNTIEKQRFIEAAKELKHSVEQIIKMHKSLISYK